MSNYHPFRHFVTITKHRHQVIRNGFHMGIFWHALKHDLSKYSHEEFHNSAKYYLGSSSPVFEQRKRENMASTVCLHHCGRNKHHWEYWADFFRGHILAKTMPYKYSVEYVCDVIAASMVYSGKKFKPNMPLDYFNERKEHYYMTKATREFVTWCFEQFKDSGWEKLKKKDTQKVYLELTSKYPDVEIFDELHCEQDLIPLV